MSRRLESFFDRLGTRPLGFLVFGVSVVALLSLTKVSSMNVVAPAVATADAVKHPALTSSFIETVHVVPGQAVDEGTPIASLSANALEHDLSLVDAEISRLNRRLDWDWAQIQFDSEYAAFQSANSAAQATRNEELADATENHSDSVLDAARAHLSAVEALAERRLITDNEVLDAEMEVSRERAQARRDATFLSAQRRYQQQLETLLSTLNDQTSLEEPMARFYQAELELLVIRREGILNHLTNLTIRARTTGHVGDVLSVGSWVEPGISVASVLPAAPEEIVAYLAPDTHPNSVPLGSIARVTAQNSPCLEFGTVLQHGAIVELVPGQLSTGPMAQQHGFPIHISIPADCALAVGQTVRVDFNVER